MLVEALRVFLFACLFGPRRRAGSGGGGTGGAGAAPALPESESWPVNAMCMSTAGCTWAVRLRAVPVIGGTGVVPDEALAAVPAVLVPPRALYLSPRRFATIARPAGPNGGGRRCCFSRCLRAAAR